MNAFAAYLLIATTCLVWLEGLWLAPRAKRNPK